MACCLHLAPANDSGGDWTGGNDSNEHGLRGFS